MATLKNAQLYDELAGEYAAHSEISAYNAHYERPAMLELLGDVRGKSVLDIGCGGGPLLRILAERGAQRLAGIDASRRLAEIARTRVPTDVTIHRGDIIDVLGGLGDSKFDCVVASLVLHYIDPLEPLFRAVSSVLNAGGRFLLSTNIPLRETTTSYVVEESWSTFGIDVARYEQSGETLRSGLLTSGFDILQIIIPRPLRSMRDVDPRAYAAVTARPAFMFVEARRRKNS